MSRPLSPRPGPPCDLGEAPPRLVLLGASNLAMGFPQVLEAARRVLGAQDLEVFAALGHGRSYGRWSRVLVRGLPGIVTSGLWPALAAAPPRRRLYGLVTDIGNDLIFGASVEETAGWVETCLSRLGEARATVVLVRLPLARIELLKPWQFRVIRTFLFPTHRAGFRDLTVKAAELDRRLTELAAAHGATAVETPAEWYGFDAIHIRAWVRRRAWREILSRWRPGARPGLEEAARGTRLGRLAWWAMAPERRTLLGVERRRPQPTGRLPDGTTVWWY